MPSPSLVLRFTTDLGPMVSDLKKMAANALPTLASVSTAAINSGESFKKLAASVRDNGLVKALQDLEKGAGASAAGTIKQLTVVNALRLAVTTAAPEIARVAHASNVAIRAFAATGTGKAVGSIFTTLIKNVIQYKLALLALSATAGVAVAGIEEVFGAAFNEVDRLIKIGTDATAAGVSATFFQAWTQQLGDLGITADKAAAALQHAKDAVSNTVDDQGVMQQNKILNMLAEQALGPNHVLGNAYDQFANATTKEAKIKAVIEAIRELNVLQQKFGQVGTLMPNLFADKLAQLTFGSKQFAEAIRKAKTNLEAFEAAGIKNGDIMPQALVDRAAAVDAELAKAAKILKEDLLPPYAQLGDIGLGLKSNWADIVMSMARAVDEVGKLNNLPAPTWLRDLPVGNSVAFLRAVMATFQTVGGVPETLKGTSPFGTIPSKTDFFAGRTVDWANPNLPRFTPLPPVRPPPSILDATSHMTAHTAHHHQADAVKNLIASLDKETASLKAELDATGKSNTAKQEAIDLAKAESAAKQRGTPLTAAETAQVLKLADAYGHLKDEQAQLQRATANAKQEAEYFGTTLESALDKALQPGARLRDVFASLAAELESAALKAAILGEGPLAGLFGTQAPVGATGGSSVGGIFGLLTGVASLFGGGSVATSGGKIAAGSFAKGGLVGTGPVGFYPTSLWAHAKSYDIGGAIPTLTHPGEIILNTAQQKHVAAAMSGGPIHLTQHFHLGGAIDADHIMAQIHSATRNAVAQARAAARSDRANDARRRN